MKYILFLLLLISSVGCALTPKFIWLCSNHTPTHAAFTINEMRDVSNQYNCTGWYRERFGE